MTTPPSTNLRPAPTRSVVNPFQRVPLPIPFEGWGMRASEVFSTRPLTAHLDRNAAWLQACPRTSNAIESALFPEYTLGGMKPDEVRSLLNFALWDAGYTPSYEGENPTWTWMEGE